MKHAVFGKQVLFWDGAPPPNQAMASYGHTRHVGKGAAEFLADFTSVFSDNWISSADHFYDHGSITVFPTYRLLRGVP